MDLLKPNQLGYACRGGAEAAVHAARLFASDKSLEDNVLLKLDFRNAFNTVRRDHILRCTLKYLPNYYNLVREMYQY